MPRNKELEIAYQILGGIPARKIDLFDIVSKQGHAVEGKPFCGTVACGLGWLLMHPRYRRKGFDIFAEDPWETKFKLPGNTNWVVRGYDNVAAKMFGISEDDAGAIFATRTYTHRYDPPDDMRMSDKKFLLARIKNYLES